ncbi:MAG: glucose-1-phosphate thymidylyltransferase RfbA [bacterium]|nr:glucose-1-phosphate thymidylyltransferase RfbA [bacterium]
MKGIILAGGSGTRLYPITKVISKQLLPIYNKPMIYYPLSTLMLAGINDILIISTPRDIPQFEQLIGDGSQFGLKVSYCEQPHPDGIAQAFLLGQDFIDGQAAALILGDNIFYGNGFGDILRRTVKNTENLQRATVFGYYVQDPQRFGVVTFDDKGQAISIEEKPRQPQSNYAVTGLYFYPSDVCRAVQTLQPSARGELEITDLNKLYLEAQHLNVQILGRGFAWFDTGTIENLLLASNFVEMIEMRQGMIISSPEEIAFLNGWITPEQLLENAEKFGSLPYGVYLRTLVKK